MGIHVGRARFRPARAVRVFALAAAGRSAPEIRAREFSASQCIRSATLARHQNNNRPPIRRTGRGLPGPGVARRPHRGPTCSTRKQTSRNPPLIPPFPVCPLCKGPAVSPLLFTEAEWRSEPCRCHCFYSASRPHKGSEFWRRRWAEGAGSIRCRCCSSKAVIESKVGSMIICQPPIINSAA
jgi:hypothetical protein